MNLCFSAMAVESVTVVAPEVKVGPFILSKGSGCVKHLTLNSVQLPFHHLICRWSSGLVEQINNFHTLRLADYSAFNLDPFLTIHDDYFYHTPSPLRPEVRIRMWRLPERFFQVPCYSFGAFALTEARISFQRLAMFVWGSPSLAWAARRPTLAQPRLWV